MTQAYCGGDPVNFVDKTGKAQTAIKSTKEFNFLTQYYDWYIPYRGAILSEAAKSMAIDYADRNGFYTERREFTGPAGGNIWHKDYQTWDNEVDAYRHFTWNVLMTRELDYYAAAMVANTHELMEQDRNGWIDADTVGYAQSLVRTKMNQPTLMDLWNNAVGRSLGDNANYKQLSSEQLFNHAKNNNMLILDATNVYSFLGVESYINTADWTVDVIWDWNTGNVTFMKEGLPDITLKIGI